jgi:hypothetical protein
MVAHVRAIQQCPTKVGAPLAGRTSSAAYRHEVPSFSLTAAEACANGLLDYLFVTLMLLLRGGE